MTEKSNLGILAYGSLIDDPGIELAPLIIDRIPCETPFKVEFARISVSRNNAPTLIPVQEGGKFIKAQILVLNEVVKIETARSMLWRRERHITDVSQNYLRPKKSGVNTVLVEEIQDFCGIQSVLYTSIGRNIDQPVTPKVLADYAIASILSGAGAQELDGVRYLLAAKKNEIITGLSEEYEDEILKATKTESLADAIQTLDSQRRDKEIFTVDFLTALSRWQNGWHEHQDKRRQIADELVKHCESLPDELKVADVSCYRKRFLVEGETIPIVLEDDFFEGIASWTTDSDYVKNFKGFVRPDTKFAMVFKHKPSKNEIIVNIAKLWNHEGFISAVEKFKSENPDAAKALVNFKDFQSEVVLRSTLKGSEIEHIVGISSSFEKLCEMGGVPESEREKLSINYARDPDGIPIEMPFLAGSHTTKTALKTAILKMNDLLTHARKNNIAIDWSKVRTAHPDDLKHKPELGYE
jgi:hypothetical protein